MKKVVILSFTPKFSSHQHHFYMFFKYENEFKSAGIKVNFCYNLKDVMKESGDILILTNRFFRNTKKDDVINIIVGFRKIFDKIYWYDLADTSGSDSFRVIPFVDLFLKKQILKDKNLYTVNEYDKSVRCWLNFEKLPDKYPNYTPCPANELNKIKVGWNIGLCDYRQLPLFLVYFRNYFPGNVKFSKPNINRLNDLTFRGNISYGVNNKISEQRNKILLLLNKIKDENQFILGSRINKNKYIEELRNTKISISPFGWGEICWRDFETILSGCLLLKPSMEHILTYPNIYIPDETYISLKWDLEDLEEKLNIVLSDYGKFIHIADQAQRFFEHSISEPSNFINHFTELI